MSETHELRVTGTSYGEWICWQCGQCPFRVAVRLLPEPEQKILAQPAPDTVHKIAHDCIAPGRVLRGPAASLTEAEESWLDGLGISWER